MSNTVGELNWEACGTCKHATDKGCDPQKRLGDDLIQIEDDAFVVCRCYEEDPDKNPDMVAG